MASSAADALVPGLPAESSRFVGRSRELKQLGNLLTKARLITVTGVGGAGKTRLALQAARRACQTFRDGVVYVSLADLQDGELTGQVVAGALGLSGAMHRWNGETLAGHVGERRMLFILDNCEQLVGACADLADTLLARCPRVTILTTSRELLAIPGEHTFPILPLTVPAPDSPLEAFGQYDAVQLFVDRAQSVVPTFELSAANHRQVAELCRTLDGLPLAVELATVRLRALSLEQIVELLAARPDLLDGPRRGGPPRHRTLNASMSWSYDLCEAREQLLWMRLSVFSGGIELDAAEAICSDGDLPAIEIMPLLTSLVDKSILIREELGGRVRYRLLETIRQFGLAALGAGSQEQLTWRRRHRDWYLEVVRRAMSDWRDGGHDERVALLRDDIANLRAALEFCVEQPGEAAAGLKMASSLYHYWLLTGLIGEGAYWIDRMLAAVEDPGAERIRGLCAAASLATLRGDVVRAAEMLSEADRFCDEHGDALGPAYVTQGRGLLALVSDDTAGAADLLAESAMQLESAGDIIGAAFTTALLGITSMLRGDSEQVAQAHDRCSRLTVPYGESWIWSFSMWATGVDAWNRGDVDNALELLCAALRLKRPLQDHLGIAECIEGLAWVTATSGQLQRAAVMLGAADAMWDRMGMSAETVPGFQRHRDESAKLARRLGLRAFQSAHREGRQMAPDDAMAYALQEVSSTGSGKPDAAKPTKREREIAELVAQGCSNQDIADTLVLSRRTVEAHVQHLLTKLGFSSRSQIAAWVAGQRSGAGRPA